MHCERQEWEQGDLFRRKDMLVQMHLAWLWLVGYDADRSGRIQHVFGDGVDTRRGSEVKESDETRRPCRFKVKYLVDFFLMWKSLFWQISIVFLKIDLKVKLKKKKKHQVKVPFPEMMKTGKTDVGKEAKRWTSLVAHTGSIPDPGRSCMLWSTDTEPALQSLGTTTPDACMQRERPPRWEVSAPQLENSHSHHS